MAKVRIHIPLPYLQEDLRRRLVDGDTPELSDHFEARPPWESQVLRKHQDLHHGTSRAAHKPIFPKFNFCEVLNQEASLLQIETTAHPPDAVPRPSATARSIIRTAFSRIARLKSYVISN